MLRALVLALTATILTGEPISFEVLQPGSNQVYGQYSFTPELVVISELELKSVTATLNNQLIPLSFDPGINRWHATGPVNLTRTPSGTNTLTYTATDVFGRTAETNVTIVVDRPPLLHVSLPDGAVARPIIYLEATCEDDMGGCSVQVMNDRDEVLMIAPKKIAGELDLSRYEGSIQRLRFYAVDDRRNQAYDVRFITSLSSPRFQPIEYFAGPILDVNEERVLSSEAAGATRFLRVLDRRTDSVQVIATNFAPYPKPALTATGVLFFLENSPTNQIIDLNDGEYLDLTGEFPVTSQPAAEVNGRYGLLSRSEYDGNGAATFIRDFVARTNAIISLGGNYTDIATNGTAVFASDRIYQFRTGELRIVVAHTNVLYHMLRTDGTNSLWFEFNALSSYDTPGTLWAETDEGVSQLGSGYKYFDVLNGITSVALNNGWIAFPRPGAQGQQQIWLRSPQGEESQGTFFAQGSTLRALREDGAILVSYGFPAKLTLIERGKAPMTLGPDLGSNYFFEGEKLRAVIGNVLFDIPLGDPLIGLSVPSIDRKTGTLSFFITATAPRTFAIERSTNLVDWISISTNAVAESMPQVVRLPVPPQRLDLRRANIYRLKLL
jgi:hypothetical protein